MKCFIMHDDLADTFARIGYEIQEEITLEPKTQTFEIRDQSRFVAKVGYQRMTEEEFEDFLNKRFEMLSKPNNSIKNLTREGNTFRWIYVRKDAYLEINSLEELHELLADAGTGLVFRVKDNGTLWIEYPE